MWETLITVDLSSFICALVDPLLVRNHTKLFLSLCVVYDIHSSKPIGVPKQVDEAVIANVFECRYTCIFPDCEWIAQTAVIDEHNARNRYPEPLGNTIAKFGKQMRPND